MLLEVSETIGLRIPAFVAIITPQHQTAILPLQL